MHPRRRPFEVSIDSLLNIAVCLLGALILIIIATGVGTSETNVVIPTPIEQHTNKRPIYIECRGNELFLIPIEELTSAASRAAQAARAASAGSEDDFLRRIAQATATNEFFRADLRHYIATAGKFLAVTPLPGAHGYPLPDYLSETEDGWFATLLSRMNRTSETLLFLVRDDSFPVFKNARLLAWQSGADVSFELLTSTEPISFPTTRR